MPKWLAIVLMGFLIPIFFFFGFFWTTYSEQSPSSFDNRAHAFSYLFASSTLYERANHASEDIKRTGSLSGIVAHHLLVADKMAQLFASLGTGREKVVVILSPNHFSLGRSSIQMTDGTWITPFGDVEVDTRLLAKFLERDSVFAYEPETFEREHGVSAIVPFVKYWFPQAHILPIVIYDKATDDQVKMLAQTIQEIVPKAVVVASMDMSHQKPEDIQLFHDEITIRTIENGLCEEKCSLDVDANRVLETLFEINRLRATQAWTLTHHGSSLTMGATTDWHENTSHILGYFQTTKDTNVFEKMFHVLVLLWKKE
ncbi:AmmeMemoRadiSam system protein B [Candidatus Uhrbacteria bacterium]|nr:AmmeMemoRadiSam system protein B [Candidatus Uhrbacteria bacterium]